MSKRATRGPGRNRENLTNRKLEERRVKSRNFEGSRKIEDEFERMQELTEADLIIRYTCSNRRPKLKLFSSIAVDIDVRKLVRLSVPVTPEPCTVGHSILSVTDRTCYF
jgi:hypothetical protein